MTEILQCEDLNVIDAMKSMEATVCSLREVNNDVDGVNAEIEAAASLRRVVVLILTVILHGTIVSEDPLQESMETLSRKPNLTWPPFIGRNSRQRSIFKFPS